jgi:hypothetical protein
MMSGYFTMLERELAASAGRRRRRHRGGRAALLAAALLMLAGVPALAVTGVLSGDDARDPADKLLHEEPIARGATPEGARWELLASEDERGFCFGVLTPTEDPREIAPAAGVTCGQRRPGALTVQIIYRGGSRHTRPSPPQTLVLGTAPEAAATVEASVRGERLAVRTIDDDRGIKGRFYVIEVPPRLHRRWQVSRRQVRALDAGGRVIARAAG